jgi:hypothetical protein
MLGARRRRSITQRPASPGSSQPWMQGWGVRRAPGTDAAPPQPTQARCQQHAANQAPAGGEGACLAHVQPAVTPRHSHEGLPSTDDGHALGHMSRRDAECCCHLRCRSHGAPLLLRRPQLLHRVLQLVLPQPLPQPLGHRPARRQRAGCCQRPRCCCRRWRRRVLRGCCCRRCRNAAAVPVAARGGAGVRCCGTASARAWRARGPLPITFTGTISASAALAALAALAPLASWPAAAAPGWALHPSAGGSVRRAAAGWASWRSSCSADGRWRQAGGDSTRSACAGSRQPRPSAPYRPAPLGPETGWRAISTHRAEVKASCRDGRAWRVQQLAKARQQQHLAVPVLQAGRGQAPASLPCAAAPACRHAQQSPGPTPAMPRALPQCPAPVPPGHWAAPGQRWRRRAPPRQRPHKAAPSTQRPAPSTQRLSHPAPPPTCAAYLTCRSLSGRRLQSDTCMLLSSGLPSSAAQTEDRPALRALLMSSGRRCAASAR